MRTRSGRAHRRGSASGAEQVAAWAKGARVVKIFNTTGANNMANPDFDGLAATMFYCGDDAEAKAAAARLATELGFDAIDADSRPSRAGFAAARASPEPG